MKPFAQVTRIEFAGMDALIFYFEYDDVVLANQYANAFTRALNNHLPEWVKDVVPSYHSVLVVFDPLAVDYHQVYQHACMLGDRASEHRSAVHHDLPVWYGAPDACDFAVIRQQTGLSDEQIIALHTGTTYQVFAVGFAPGFGYLGDIPEQLACPRLATPRTKVPKGAVAIADRQTAVYPGVSPGGWNLLGLCPTRLFDIHREPASLLSAGDTVRFYPISEQDYYAQHE